MGFHKLSENQVPVPAENTWTFYKDENENNNEDADEWPFGVLRLCADKFHVIGCATNDSCNEYRCFFQSLDEGQDAFYVEGQACDDPYEAYYELMQQETPALEDYEDIFAVYPVSDMYFMALSLAENNLWN